MYIYLMCTEIHIHADSARERDADNRQEQRKEKKADRINKRNNDTSYKNNSKLILIC